MRAADLTPADFLREVLRTAPDGSVGWITTFKVPPTTDDPRLWVGKRCGPDALPRINGVNAYYSVAAFAADAPARKIDTMLGTFVVLLDDIGSKADPALALRLFGEPSYKIQSSQNSQQWGYLLERLAMNDEIAPIHQRLGPLEMCDKNGVNAVRYGRLPAGTNNKPEYGEPFAVRLVEWNPERVFEVERIAAALEAERAPGARGEQKKTETTEDDDFQALAAEIMAGDNYHGPLQTLSAKYSYLGYPASDTISILQGHMLNSEDRSARWKARFDDIARTVRTAAKFRPSERADTIVVRSGQQAEIIDAALTVLAKRGVAASIFVRGKMLVRPYLARRFGFKDEPVLSLEMAQLTATALAYELNGLIAFKRPTKKERAKRIDCPAVIPNTVLALPHRWEKLPRLDAIVSSPIYLGNGRLLVKPGYHAEKRVWLTVPPGVLCKERPTRKEAEHALLRLRAYLEEFQFARAVDEAAMMAAMMMAALRASLATCPGAVFDAPEFGSGKTTAAKVVHLIGFGRLPAVMNFSADPNEMRKLIDAAQIEGRQSLVFDNVPSGVVVTHDSLAQVLTEREREARELGASRTHIVPCNQLVLFTGNNINVGEDLTRRLVGCRLDPVGDPTARTFKRPDLLADVVRDRVSILSDIFTIVAAYEAAGDPVRIEPLVGYDDWCRWVQRSLVWLGCEDPVASVRELQAEDEDRANLEEVVVLWDAVFGSEWVSAKALYSYDATRRDQPALEELRGVLRGTVGVDREGNVDSIKMGYWLRKNKERWTRGGLRIERKSKSAKSNRAAQWRVWPRGRGSGGSGGCSIPSSPENAETEGAIGAKSPHDTLHPPRVEGDEENIARGETPSIPLATDYDDGM